MTDKTKTAISEAIDALGRGASRKTNGKITAVNLAIEAGVSKATLYRYFENHSDLLTDFEAVKSRRANSDDGAPLTIDDALKNAREEITALRKALSSLEDNAAARDKLLSHQILVLWKENERLNTLIKRMEANDFKSNVISLNDNSK